MHQPIFGTKVASIGMIVSRAKYEIITHVLCISTSLYVASKYSAINNVTFDNLETILLFVLVFSSIIACNIVLQIRVLYIECGRHGHDGDQVAHEQVQLEVPAEYVISSILTQDIFP
jgi:hypothetical protein